MNIKRVPMHIDTHKVYSARRTEYMLQDRLRRDLARIDDKIRDEHHENNKKIYGKKNTSK